MKKAFSIPLRKSFDRNNVCQATCRCDLFDQESRAAPYFLLALCSRVNELLLTSYGDRYDLVTKIEPPGVLEIEDLAGA